MSESQATVYAVGIYEKSRNIYTVAPSASGMVSYYPLYKLDDKGKVTSEYFITHDATAFPDMSDHVNPQDNPIVRDATTGRLYYQTTNQSRFLDYGLSEAAQAGGNHQLVAMDYAGNTKTWIAENEQRPSMDSGTINTYNLTLKTKTENMAFTNLSIVRLLILITLRRAEEMEVALLDQIKEMTTSNALLSTLSDIADSAVQQSPDTVVDLTTTKFPYKGKDVSIYDFFTKNLEMEDVATTMTYGDLMNTVKNKQDELNNMSQETMLNIQKLITARDQAYLLGSIGTKLFQNGNVMIGRNI